MSSLACEMEKDCCEKVGDDKPLFETREAALNAEGSIMIHYKGGVYRKILEDVKEDKNATLGVVYEHLFPNKHGYFFRPNTVFYSKTEDGRMRFQSVNPEEDTKTRTLINFKEILKDKGRFLTDDDNKVYRLCYQNVKHTEEETSGVVCETVFPYEGSFTFIQENDFIGKTKDGKPRFTELGHRS